MDKKNRPQPAIVVIFGASGDLARRKIVPALYNLFLDEWLPDAFAIVGVARTPMSDDGFRQHLLEGLTRFSRRKVQEDVWQSFARHLSYVSGDYHDDAMWERLSSHLAEMDGVWHTEQRRAFYLATPPSIFVPAVQRLGIAGLCRDCDLTRVVVEKPFGHDLQSAQALNHMLSLQLEESQIYRMDHYLGKETVQNLFAFRFGNSIFEPIWNRRYIDHVQIMVSEELGVEHRGGYYEQSGALRDIVQNHILQMMCLVAMEAPVSFAADEVRSKMVDVLNAIPLLSPEQVGRQAVRGQYDAGVINGKPVPGYRDEPDVSPASSTETYAAVKLYVDNWRWQDVPFYLRTGKRLPGTKTNITIQFKPVPHQTFPDQAVTDWQPNRLSICVQPQERIQLRIQVKEPGQVMHLDPVNMDFRYSQHFGMASPEAYETLLLDILHGDATLFMRADQVEAAWRAMMPIIEAWESHEPKDFPNYAAGTWGPEAADHLIEREGRRWLMPDT